MKRGVADDVAQQTMSVSAIASSMLVSGELHIRELVGQLLAEGGGAVGRASGDGDGSDSSYGENSADLVGGLSAGPDQREAGRVGRREEVGGDADDGAGSQGG